MDLERVGWMVLGFLIPILGLILWLVWKEEYPFRAKCCGLGALISVIVSIVLVVLYLIIILFATCVAIGTL